MRPSRAPASNVGAGQLFLAVNDDQLGDNQGAFAVTVRLIRRR